MLLSSKTLNQVRSLNLTSNQPIIISGPEFTYKELLSKKIASQSLEIDIDKFPVTFKLEEQGQFAIGYYHQKQAQFGKSELKEITEEE